MRRGASLLAIALATLVVAMPVRSAAQVPAAPGGATPTRIVLVGDSTVTDDSGWGLGFRQMLDPAVTVVNVAANGRSSKSFIDEGRWRAALAMRGDYYLIQFGHNDESGKGPERETIPETTYRANLERYVDEVRAQGAVPVLVTSLVRRLFEPGTNRIRSTQTPYVEVVRSVAAERQVPLIDLFAASSEVVTRMGEAALVPYSPRTADGSVDTTHLNADGSLLFGRLVAEGLTGAVPELSGFVQAPRTAASIRIEHPPDAIVAASGPATLTTVQEAINAVSPNTTPERRWWIFVMAGAYRERIHVQREKRFVSLVGEDPLTTAITFDAKGADTGPDGLPIGSYRTPTMVVDADDFAIENLTIENAAGPGSQALALRVDGDRLVVRNSRLLGWQDTLFVNRGRQYFEDTLIAGHVDFIFGGATTWFERCRLHAWADGYITAASTLRESPFGIVFSDCRITGETADVRTYLGRPWRSYAHVTWLRTEMSEVVRPEGWHNWNQPDRETTIRYGEFGSRGPGAAPDDRVAWARRLTSAEASGYTIDRVLGGPDG